MPTYLVTTCVRSLSPDAKARIAKEITRVHQEVTGAQKFFAEVIFRDVPREDFFMGGKPLQHDTIYVHGHIRSGRTEAQKQSLISKMVTVVAAEADVPTRCIWIYINEIPPSNMAEFGHILPQPGEENSWYQGLPEYDRKFLENLNS